MRPASVIILREQDTQTTGGSCCGKLDGGLSGTGAGGPFAERRAGMEAAGHLARAVVAAFGEAVTVTQVDPRNLPAVWWLLVRDCRRAHRGWRAWVRALSLTVRVPSVFVDGEAVAAGAWPSPAIVHRAVRDRLPEMAP